MTALDQSEAMLRGRANGARRTRASRSSSGEAEHLPFDDAAFDALTFTYLLRYVDDPAATLAELARVVKPGGRIGMVEFGVPDEPGAQAAVACAHAGRAARSWAARSPPPGMRWDASWARTSSSSTPRTPTSPRCGSAAGIDGVHRAPDELRGGPGHVGSPRRPRHLSPRARLQRPAFYALAPGGWRDLITLLHPPYTAWHLSYVALGAAVAPTIHAGRLGAALAAFFLAVGIAAHALDELHGRPLQTRLSDGRP